MRAKREVSRDEGDAEGRVRGFKVAGGWYRLEFLFREGGVTGEGGRVTTPNSRSSSVRSHHSASSNLLACSFVRSFFALRIGRERARVESVSRLVGSREREKERARELLLPPVLVPRVAGHSSIASNPLLRTCVALRWTALKMALMAFFCASFSCLSASRESDPTCLGVGV